MAPISSLGNVPRRIFRKALRNLGRITLRGFVHEVYLGGRGLRAFLSGHPRHTMRRLRRRLQEVKRRMGSYTIPDFT